MHYKKQRSKCTSLQFLNFCNFFFQILCKQKNIGKQLFEKFWDRFSENRSTVKTKLQIQLTQQNIGDLNKDSGEPVVSNVPQKKP